jgi:hypothetical protein
MIFHRDESPLPGILPMDNRIAFLEQVIDSLRRVEYVQVISQKNIISVDRTNPGNRIFDPLYAAVIEKRNGNLDEACWLVFLSTHFGKNLRTGWKLTREIYGALDSGHTWSWNNVQNNLADFKRWIAASQGSFLGKFGNHRKYESLRDTNNGTGAVVESYIRWIEEYGSHIDVINTVQSKFNNNKLPAFGYLYKDMKKVKRFGRTGKFDYLTMLAKMNLMPIEADLPYFTNATGPVRGARLFFTGAIAARIPPKKLESMVVQLNKFLPLGMQVWEDSLCNWQKSPNKYLYFNG